MKQASVLPARLSIICNRKAGGSSSAPFPPSRWLCEIANDIHLAASSTLNEALNRPAGNCPWAPGTAPPHAVGAETTFRGLADWFCTATERGCASDVPKLSVCALLQSLRDYTIYWDGVYDQYRRSERARSGWPVSWSIGRIAWLFATSCSSHCQTTRGTPGWLASATCLVYSSHSSNM